VACGVDELAGRTLEFGASRAVAEFDRTALVALASRCILLEIFCAPIARAVDVRALFIESRVLLCGRRIFVARDTSIIHRMEACGALFAHGVYAENRSAGIVRVADWARRAFTAAHVFVFPTRV